MATIDCTLQEKKWQAAARENDAAHMAVITAQAKLKKAQARRRNAEIEFMKACEETREAFSLANRARTREHDAAEKMNKAWTAYQAAV